MLCHNDVYLCLALFMHSCRSALACEGTIDTAGDGCSCNDILVALFKFAKSDNVGFRLGDQCGPIVLAKVPWIERTGRWANVSIGLDEICAKVNRDNFFWYLLDVWCILFSVGRRSTDDSGP